MLILVEFCLMLASHYKDNGKFWEEILPLFLLLLHNIWYDNDCVYQFKWQRVYKPLPSNDNGLYQKEIHSNKQTKSQGDPISTFFQNT
jgi:hypothetical protein